MKNPYSYSYVNRPQFRIYFYSSLYYPVYTIIAAMNLDEAFSICSDFIDDRKLDVVRSLGMYYYQVDNIIVRSF